MSIKLPDGTTLDTPDRLGLQESKVELPPEEAVFGDHKTSKEESDLIKKTVEDTGILVMKPLVSVDPAAKYRLKYKEHAQLPKLAAYRTNFDKQEVIDKLVDELLVAGLVEKSNGPYSSPVTLAYRNGKPRLCFDYRKLNEQIIHDAFPIPLINDLVSAFSGGNYFTTLDLAAAFHHIEIENEEDRDAMAFQTQRGLFRPKRLMFGLATAPAQMQRLMNQVLKP
jgi:hypothetical protein